MAKILAVNFEGVESGGSSVVIPEGDYGFKVNKIVQKTGDKGPYLRFDMKAISGDPKGVGKVVPHICSLGKNSLWNLRNLLEATGRQIPSKAIKLDLDKIVGSTLAGTVVDDEYNKKKKSTISAFFPLADLNKEEEKDEDTDSDSDTEDSTEEAESSDDNTEEEEELFG